MKDRKSKSRRLARPPLERSVFTVTEFCGSHGIGRAKLYELWAAGEGPRIFRVGRKVLISKEAAADWVRSLESK